MQFPVTNSKHSLEIKRFIPSVATMNHQNTFGIWSRLTVSTSTTLAQAMSHLMPRLSQQSKRAPSCSVTLTPFSARSPHWGRSSRTFCANSPAHQPCSVPGAFALELSPDHVLLPGRGASPSASLLRSSTGAGTELVPCKQMVVEYAIEWMTQWPRMKRIFKLSLVQFGEENSNICF